MIVLVDDERIFKASTTTEDYILLKNQSEALKWLNTVDETSVIDQLWLDHDLGEENGRPVDVMPFVRELERRCFENISPNIGQIVVHTSNLVGGKDIVRALERHFNVHRVYAGDYLEARSKRL